MKEKNITPIECQCGYMALHYTDGIFKAIYTWLQRNSGNRPGVL